MSVQDRHSASIVVENDETGYRTCGCATPHKTVVEFVDCVLQRCAAKVGVTPLRPRNLQLVQVAGDTVEIRSVRTRMTTREALEHAAWIVALIDDEDTFNTILAHLQRRNADFDHA
jgi:hypothetical protein